jgi:hypothetical protein
VPTSGHDLFGASAASLADEIQTVLNAWSSMASRTGLPGVRLLNDQRVKRLKRCLEQVGVKGMLEAIDKVERSRWCNGENSTGWRASFDFILQQKSLAGLLEHGYAWKNKSGLGDSLRAILGDNDG